jgi:hypothetical protein
MKCVICDRTTNKSIHLSYSSIGPDGERHHGAGRFYVCNEHSGLVKTMPTQELELFVRANAQPAFAVTEENKSVNSNGNGTTPAR